MPNLGKLVKEAARMQEKMEKVQAELASRTVEASSGGGAVKVVARCDGTVAAIKIDPQAANASDVSMLEDLVTAAVNEALVQVQAFHAENMAGLTGGLDLGALGLGGMPGLPGAGGAPGGAPGAGHPAPKPREP